MRVYFELMDAILSDGPPKDFDRVECPVLIAWGTRDRILPAPRYSRRFKALVPHAEWADLPGLGHVPVADDPELVSRTITDFVRRSSRAESSDTSRLSAVESR